MIQIDAIAVLPGRRKLVKADVDTLMASITRIGLMTPITVLPAGPDGKYPLVAGRHRHDACRRLGHETIEVRVINSKVEAELWEIAENLHRADLTALQRTTSIGRWIKLTANKIALDQMDKPGQVGPVSGKGGRGLKGGINAAARELGISETTAKRSVRIAEGLKPSAQKEAVKLGLDDNQKVLEIAAGCGSAENQVHVLRKRAAWLEKRKEVKAQIAANHAKADQPKTFQQAFDRWFRTLDVDMQMKGRIWLLGLDAEAYVAELEKTDELLRADRRSLH